jgi:hypothetical protein
MVELPKLTHPQYLAVHLLFSGPKTPRALRRGLTKAGMRRSLGTFSRLVRRLESIRCLEVAYDNPQGGRRLHDCKLVVTDIGVMSWKATREFFASRSPPPAGLVPVQAKKGPLLHPPARLRKSTLKKRRVQGLREGKKESEERPRGVRRRARAKSKRSRPRRSV